MNSFGWEVESSEEIGQAISDAITRITNLLDEERRRCSSSRNFRELREEDDALEQFLQEHKARVVWGNPGLLPIARDPDHSVFPEYRQLIIPPWCAFYLVSESDNPPLCRTLFFCHERDLPERIKELSREALKLYSYYIAVLNRTGL